MTNENRIHKIRFNTEEISLLQRTASLLDEILGYMDYGEQVTSLNYTLEADGIEEWANILNEIGYDGEITLEQG